jgi:hypothetical protein
MPSKPALLNSFDSNGSAPLSNSYRMPPQRIDVRPGVDFLSGHFRLLGTHVFRRADQHAQLGEHRLLGQSLSDGLGHAEVDDLGLGFALA